MSSCCSSLFFSKILPFLRDILLVGGTAVFGEDVGGMGECILI